VTPGAHDEGALEALVVDARHNADQLAAVLRWADEVIK